jgi:spore germination protein GerM
MPRIPQCVLMVTTILAAPACGDRTPDGARQPTAQDAAVTDVVYPYFTSEEAPQPVPREVPAQLERHPVHATLEQLLAGPTEAERDLGFHSFFSAGTAGMLRDVTLDGGRLTVDFEDLRPVIPNASASAGSELLLGELNASVFQFIEVREVEYRIEGSCEAFWEWLQRACEIVERPSW